jgi:predicted nucleic acid-binding protein
MRLADTSFWVALAAERDEHHAEAVRLWSAQSEPVLVTNHIAGETWTFLRRRAGHKVAMAALAVFRSSRVRSVRVEAKDEDEAWRWLQRHDERPYSFVDATSFAVMRRLRAREVFAFDNDFTAVGFSQARAPRT